LPHVNLHAIAIDEQRQPFEPSLWRRSKFKHFNTAVLSRWMRWRGLAGLGPGDGPSRLSVA